MRLTQIGLLFVFSGIANAIVQAMLVERLSKRLGDRGVAIGSLFGQAGMALVTMITPSLLLLYPVSVVRSAVTGFIWSSMGHCSASASAIVSKGCCKG